MWTENNKAPMKTKKSPRPMVKSSVIHRKYSPISARKTPNHTRGPDFLLKNIPIIGTIIM